MLPKKNNEVSTPGPRPDPPGTSIKPELLVHNVECLVTSAIAFARRA